MVKNAAKLVLFLSVSFFGLLLFSGFTALFYDWTGTALLFPPDSGFSGDYSGNIAHYIRSSIPLAFYLSILLGLNYAARRRIAYPAAFTLILVVILSFGAAAFLGLESLENARFSLIIKKPQQELAKPGFLLDQGALSGYQTVFLEDPAKPDGAVVRIIQGQNLLFLRRAKL